MIKRNTSKLWDKVWVDNVSIDQDIYDVVMEEKSTRWSNIKAQVKNFKNLNVIEIGAGAGTNAALFAKLGSKVTILDYSQKALKRSREFFQRNNLTANFVLADALKLPKQLLGQFDIAMSFGLAEHFINHDRTNIVKSHFDLIKEGGLAIISVPNKYCLPYQIIKLVSQNTRYWKVGEEYPFSRQELENICKQIDISDCDITGESFLRSLNYINPIWIVKKILKIKPNFDTTAIEPEAANFLDYYFGYSLTLFGRH